MIVFRVLPFVPPVALVVWASWATRGGLLSRWAATYNVDVPADYHPAVERHLLRAVWAASVGALIGWAVSEFTVVSAGALWGLVLGYLVGVVMFEITARRDLGRGVAALSPRHLSAYVPRWSILLLRFVGLCAFGSSAFLMVMTREWFHAGRMSLGDQTILRVAFRVGVAVLVTAFTGELLTRWVITRRQIVGAVDLLTVDDALRATAARRMIAASLSGALLGFAVVVAGEAAILDDAPLWETLARTLIGVSAFGSGAVLLVLRAPSGQRRVRRRLDLAPH